MPKSHLIYLVAIASMVAAVIFGGMSSGGGF